MKINLIEAIVYSIAYESVDEKWIVSQMRIFKKLTGLSYKRINRLICDCIDRTCWSYQYQDWRGCYTLPFNKMDRVTFCDLGQFIDACSCDSREHQEHMIKRG